MATLGGGMAVLPQYQGNYYDLQMQQALAQALMQKALTPQQLPPTVGSGGSQNYQVAPRLSPLAALGGGAANGMLANALMSKTGQGFNDLGMQQWNALTGGNPAAGMGASGGSASPLQSAPAAVNDDSAGASGVSGGVSQQPQGMLSPGGPMNPLGMPSQQAAMMYLNAPDKYWEAQAGAYKPTDMSLMLRQAGVDPSSPLGRQVMQQAIVKANNIPLVSGRAGAPMYDYQGNVVAMAPKIPDNAIPIVQNGQVTGVTALPGATAVEKANAAAGSIGKAYGNVQTGFVDGQPTFVNSGALADQTAGGASPFGNSNGRYPGNQGGNVQPSLAPAASAAQTTMGEKSAAQYAAEQNSAGGFGTRMFNLNKALTGLQNAQTGPGSDSVNTVRSFLMAQGPQVLQSLGIVDPNKIQSYDEANKYLTQYAMNQAGALGEGTDAKLATTLSGNANTHISNLAAQDVVKANMALERMNQAAVNSFGQTGLGPEKYSAWKAQFASRVDPRVFAWDMMDKSKQQAMYNGMNDAQRNQFRTQYNWAIQNGFLGQ